MKCLAEQDAAESRMEQKGRNHPCENKPSTKRTMKTGSAWADKTQAYLLPLSSMKIPSIFKRNAPFLILFQMGSSFLSLNDSGLRYLRYPEISCLPMAAELNLSPKTLPLRSWLHKSNSQGPRFTDIVEDLLNRPTGWPIGLKKSFKQKRSREMGLGMGMPSGITLVIQVLLQPTHTLSWLSQHAKSFPSLRSFPFLLLMHGKNFMLQSSPHLIPLHWSICSNITTQNRLLSPHHPRSPPPSVTS